MACHRQNGCRKRERREENRTWAVVVLLSSFPSKNHRLSWINYATLLFMGKVFNLRVVIVPPGIPSSRVHLRSFVGNDGESFFRSVTDCELNQLDDVNSRLIVFYFERKKKENCPCDFDKKFYFVFFSCVCLFHFEKYSIDE